MMANRADEILDLTLGGLLLILALPAMAFSAALVLITSGRPVLFRQKRMGKSGIPFEILKFRSMIRGADQVEWPPKTPDGAPPERQLRKHDPRITLAGRVLRRWALDELPQLFNVLRGDMSLVGPRPLPVDEWARLRARPGHEPIAMARPGMTGPHQVAVRLGFNVSDARRIELEYIHRHSVVRYLRILAATPLALTMGGGDLLRPPSDHASDKGRSVASRGAHPTDDAGEMAAALAVVRDTYLFNCRGREFVLDPVTTKTFVVDQSASRILNLIRSGNVDLGQDAIAGSNGTGGALQELLSFGRGMAQARSPQSSDAAANGNPSECRLMLDVTRRCTLRCGYCYTGSHHRVCSTPEDMSWEVAAAAIDLLARLAKEWDCPGFLNFTGGEPLLRYDFLVPLAVCLESEAEREGLNLRCSFGSTNGTVHPPGIADYLERTGHVISASLDGEGPLHNTNRPFRDGRGSHRDVEAFVQEMLRRGVAKSAAVTLTENNRRPKDALEYLVALGFQSVVMKPARLQRDHALALNEGNIRGLFDGYEDLISFLAETTLSGHPGYLLAVLNPQDYLGRFLLRVLHGGRLSHRCPAARSSFGVSTDGTLYPCASFTDIEEFAVGNVVEGVDWEKCQRFLPPAVDEKPGCSECWARHLCGGGCAHAAYLVNGNIAKPDEVKCALIKHLCSLSCWFWAELSDKCPSVVADALRQTIQHLPAVQLRGTIGLPPPEGRAGRPRGRSGRRSSALPLRRGLE